MRTAISLITAALIAAWALPTGAAILANGDFSAGNTGFTSTGTYKATGSLAYGEYSVRTNPTSANGGWCGADHTTGAGNMLMVDSAVGAVWSQTVNLLPGDYSFSAWVVNVLCPGTNIDDPELELRVNGVVVAGPLTLPENNYQWVPMAGTFTRTGAGPVTFEVWSKVNWPNGTDFGVDDILVDIIVPVETSTWGKVKALYR